MNLLWWRKKKLKDFTLTIKIDPNITPGFSTASKIVSFRVDDKHAKSILAHELGHVMSMIFRSPITRKSEVTDIQRNVIGLRELSQREELLTEEEAWTFARMILPGKIDEEFVEYALSTYGK